MKDDTNSKKIEVRQKYNEPKLSTYGTLSQLTQAKSVSGVDNNKPGRH